MKSILYLTDLYYPARGRKYYEEDLFITSRLKPHFQLLIANPQQAIPFLETADLVVFRNTGPILEYREYFQEFLAEVEKKNILTLNSFDGKADLRGKQYLIELTRQGYPVIPTIENISELQVLGNPDKYVLKLKHGADSIGMEFLDKAEVLQRPLSERLIQPYLDFKYEVSFYFLNDEFQYALYAPDKDKRWELANYRATSGDLEFANRFIQWNNIKHGITRVDACRLQDGSLLLVELEDLNPYLSLHLLENAKRDEFVQNLVGALKAII